MKTPDHGRTTRSTNQHEEVHWGTVPAPRLLPTLSSAAEELGGHFGSRLGVSKHAPIEEILKTNRRLVGA